MPEDSNTPDVQRASLGREFLTRFIICWIAWLAIYIAGKTIRHESIIDSRQPSIIVVEILGGAVGVAIVAAPAALLLVVLSRGLKGHKKIASVVMGLLLFLAGAAVGAIMGPPLGLTRWPLIAFVAMMGWVGLATRILWGYIALRRSVTPPHP